MNKKKNYAKQSVILLTTKCLKTICPSKGKTGSLKNY